MRFENTVPVGDMSLRRRKKARIVKERMVAMPKKKHTAPYTVQP